MKHAASFLLAGALVGASAVVAYYWWVVSKQYEAWPADWQGD